MLQNTTFCWFQTDNNANIGPLKPLLSFQNARQSDPVSAFGGVVACNFKINFKIASEINKTFLETNGG